MTADDADRRFSASPGSLADAVRYAETLSRLGDAAAPWMRLVASGGNWPKYLVYRRRCTSHRSVGAAAVRCCEIARMPQYPRMADNWREYFGRS